MITTKKEINIKQQYQPALHASQTQKALHQWHYSFHCHLAQQQPRSSATKIRNYISIGLQSLFNGHIWRKNNGIISILLNMSTITWPWCVISVSWRTIVCLCLIITMFLGKICVLRNPGMLSMTRLGGLLLSGY